MIVKNETAVLERCLSSVRGLVDSWVISDTGSTDGTQKLVRDLLADVPGELSEDEWVNFGHNRTLNIRRARGRADYLLLLDADLVLRREGGMPLLTADSYMLRHDGNMSYRIKRLVRGDINWRYEGVTHEYLTTNQQHTQENIDALYIQDFADGGSRHDKFERDARLLGQELRRDRSNPRTVFYLAQTMRDLERKEEAIKFYEQRASMGGWLEEVYYSLLQVGILKHAMDDWSGALDSFLRAWEARPQRLEASYELASRLRTRGSYQTACAILRAVVDQQAPDDLLFMQPWIYRWGLLFEFSIALYWIGDMAASLEACDRLLEIRDLPDSYREQTILNREYAMEGIAGLEKASAVPQAR